MALDTLTYTGILSSLAQPQGAGAEFDALVIGSKWGLGPVGSGAAVSYGFPAELTQYNQDRAVPGSYNLFEPTGGGYSNLLQRFTPFDEPAQAAAADALAAWSRVAGIRFEAVVVDSLDAATMRFAYTAPPAVDSSLAGAAIAPQDFPAAGDVWMNGRWARPQGWAAGTQSFSTLLHEVGHAIGLKHAHDTGLAGVPGWPATFATLPHEDVVLSQHSSLDTVMAYNDAPGRGLEVKLDFAPTTPMRLDIAALQYLYGPNLAHEAGDSLYTFDMAGRYLQTIWDAGGQDTLVVQGAADAVVSLVPGSWSRLGQPLTYAEVGFEGEVLRALPELTRAETVYIFDTVWIENAIGGAGNDWLVGNERANRLQGGPGDDRIDGGAGLDGAVFAGALAASTARPDGDDWVVSGPDGIDRLNGIERLHFDDRALALDTGAQQAAGQVAQILRALFGPAALGDAGFAGIGIGLADQGATYEQLVALALGTGEFQGQLRDGSAAAFVELLFGHVVGRAPNAAERDRFVAQLDEGLARTELALMAAQVDLNGASADLVGLAATGLVYLPVADGA